jgi:hypothetical protein
MYSALRSMRMKRSLLVGFALTTLLAGCASEPEVRPTKKDRHARHARTGGWATGEVSGDDQSMDMEMSIGVLDERVVDRAMKPHIRALSACFSRAGDARKYLSGQVVMRFLVSAKGDVSDVQVIRNGLGSFPVESCLVAQGKRIVFPAPEGRKATDFEYSMTFESTGERSVIPWSGEELARHLYGIADALAGCGTMGTSDVDVVAYVEPGGLIGSVGFASQGSLDGVAAECAATAMRRVRISDAPTSGHSGIVLRAVFPMKLAFERPVGEASRKLARQRHRP